MKPRRRPAGTNPLSFGRTTASLLFAMRLTALLSALLLAAAPLCAADAGLTLAGFDLLGAKFSTGLTALAKRTGVSLTLNLTGSHSGLESLQNGKADVALLVFAPQEKPPGPPFVALPVAYHTVIAVVPADLPLEQLSFAQLLTIYSVYGGDQPPKNWDALGVPASSPWSHLPIAPVLSGSGGGLAYDLFRHDVLTSHELRAIVVVETDGAAALKHLADGSSGLALVASLPPGRKDLKALSLSRGANSTAYGPTPENVHAGDYPVRLPLQVVIRAEAAKRALPLLRLLFSAEAVPLWQEAQLVPLSTSDREDQVAKFESK